MTSSSFKQIGLNKKFLRVVKDLYFENPTKIQAEVIPLILNGKSVVGQSQTGSGKTHAFLLPLLQNFNKDKDETQIVITAPTRELSIQIHTEIKELLSLLGEDGTIVPRLITGGMDRPKMMKQLQHKAHIIIGTPGRILDMVNEGVLSIYSATSFVIDEADLMLDMRFIEEIDQLLVKSNQLVQILVFSATIPISLQHFIKKYLNNPITIKIGEKLSPEKLEHWLIDKRHRDVGELLLDMTNAIQPYVAIIFVNSKDSADNIVNYLKQKGLSVGVLHGDLTSRERVRTVKAITNLQYQYIVATDLASRGIDLKGASHVINAELPKELNFYVHRVGRTARAGSKGLAINIFTEEDLPLIQQLEKNGILFKYVDIKNSQWTETKKYDYRKGRKEFLTEVDKEAWKRVKKTKKVKPGYKKKMKKEQEKIKRELLNKKNKHK